MQKLNRRLFVKRGLASLGALSLFSQIPGRLVAEAMANFNEIPIGFQTFTIRDMLGKDFPGVLKTMSGFGYKITEMCSPQGYAQLGFGFLKDTKPSDIKKTINDAGLSCPSCHFGYEEMTTKLDESIAFSQELGLSQMICSTFWLPKTSTLDEYYQHADKLNRSAAKIKQAGMSTGFHNHEMEFAMLEGKLIYDALMSKFDPELVKMQFQTEVINLGYKASTYFDKYPGRFISSHLSDWTADKKEAVLGQG